jgi:hypothetical protein
VSTMAGQRVVVVGGTSGMGLAAVFAMTSPQMTGAVLEVSGGESLVSPLEATS